MTAIRLDCTATALRARELVARNVQELGFAPGLAVVLGSEDPGSVLYRTYQMLKFLGVPAIALVVATSRSRRRLWLASTCTLLLILSTAMMLDWLATRHAEPALEVRARLLERALQIALRSGTVPMEIGGRAGLDEMTRATLDALPAAQAELP